MSKLKDHRQIGQELDIFAVSERVGGGLPLFTPKGTVIRRSIHGFIEKLQQGLGYSEVWIPHMAKPELYELSGHLEKYPEYFMATSANGDDFILKPMDCPHHMEIFRSRPRSYRDLPIAYSEFTTNYRDEQTGELNGLLRVRSLTIDDCHIFCREDQVLEEAKKVYKTIVEFYKVFNFKIRVRLSFRDPKNKAKYIGSDESWDKAEELIRKLAKDIKFDKEESTGEAAFYGPKLDFMIRDILDREWQLATIQLDYLIPARLGIEFVDSDNTKKNPVVIHRAIAGSIERFIGILLEHYQGSLPLWLSPVQVVVIPVTDMFEKQASIVYDLLRFNDIRCEIDLSNHTLGAKIRTYTLQKVPYMCIIGAKEAATLTVKNGKLIQGNIAIRTREGKDNGNQSITEFVKNIRKNIEQKT